MTGDLVIEGNVKIVIDDAVGEFLESNPFEYLKHIDGKIIIRNTDLTTLSYFDGVKEVGELNIEDNPDLECGRTYFPLLGAEGLHITCH